MSSIARTIDHSLLHPMLTDDELRAGCLLARRLEVASVCIKPYGVPLAAELLAGSNVAVGTVIGFPHGGHTTRLKVAEAQEACSLGASELDMVVNPGKVLSADWRYVSDEIAAVVRAAHDCGAMVKVILENDYLANDEPKRRLCSICEQAGAEFVKTSTGFGFVKIDGGGYGYRGATEHDLRLMRASCGPAVGIKAAGGVRTYREALAVLALGVTRIGASATEAILAEERTADAGKDMP